MAMEYQPAEADITSPVVVRRARPEDAQSSGQICYEAFRTLNVASGSTHDPCSFFWPITAVFLNDFAPLHPTASSS